MPLGRARELQDRQEDPRVKESAAGAHDFFGARRGDDFGDRRHSDVEGAAGARVDTDALAARPYSARLARCLAASCVEQRKQSSGAIACDLNDALLVRDRLSLPVRAAASAGAGAQLAGLHKLKRPPRARAIHRAAPSTVAAVSAATSASARRPARAVARAARATAPLGPLPRRSAPPPAQPRAPARRAVCRAVRRATAPLRALPPRVRAATSAPRDYPLRRRAPSPLSRPRPRDR